MNFQDGFELALKDIVHALEMVGKALDVYHFGYITGAVFGFFVLSFVIAIPILYMKIMLEEGVDRGNPPRTNPSLGKPPSKNMADMEGKSE